MSERLTILHYYDCRYTMRQRLANPDLGRLRNQSRNKER